MKKENKSPASHEVIFKTMMYMTFGVGSVFFLKNLLTKSFQGALAVGICLVVFAVVVTGMKKMQVPQVKQQLILCICLVFLTFFISANSGSYYSDDFPLFLAVLSLSGLYLEPSYTKYQTILITVLLLILYFLHPEKAESMSQFIMCLVILDVAAYVIYMVIKRGRAYIELGNMRAEEAEHLLRSIEKVGDELKESYENSNSRIEGLREVNERLEENANELRKGSAEVIRGTNEVQDTCVDVQERMQVTENHIESLNAEVKMVEGALEESKRHMVELDGQIQSVKDIVGNTNEVFKILQERIVAISEATEQLTAIAASTKMLALNASIEAARAGETGKGFAVVATNVQDLAYDSNQCSDKVIRVVEDMKSQIEHTTAQLSESVDVIENSLISMGDLENGFDDLIERFESLYGNIEEQNRNIINVDDIFGDLKNRIAEMSAYSEENQSVVEAIVDAMNDYKSHMGLIVDDAKQLYEISANMMESADESLQ